MSIHIALLVCLSLALLLVVIALAREIRLRRTLQLLLARLLALWRSRSDQIRSPPSIAPRSADSSDDSPT